VAYYKKDKEDKIYIDLYLGAIFFIKWVFIFKDLKSIKQKMLVNFVKTQMFFNV